MGEIQRELFERILWRQLFVNSHFKRKRRYDGDGFIYEKGKDVEGGGATRALVFGTFLRTTGGEGVVWQLFGKGQSVVDQVLLGGCGV